MPLNICEINLDLFWAASCVISSGTGESKFAINSTKLYALVVTLSTQNYCSNYNHVLNEHLTGININQNYQ